MAITIELTKGKYTIVDESFAHLKQYRWFYLNAGTGYAGRQFTQYPGKQSILLIHHAIVGFPIDGKVVDHINGDSLDNRVENLRFATVRENQTNTAKHRSGRLAGAWKDKDRWHAGIEIGGKTVNLGYYLTMEAANRAYISKSSSLKEKCRVNCKYAEMG